MLFDKNVTQELVTSKYLSTRSYVVFVCHFLPCF
jgi:hypothetical protein